MADFQGFAAYNAPFNPAICAGCAVQQCQELAGDADRAKSLARQCGHLTAGLAV